MNCDIITESLIKGIIVTYSRTGITVSKIANIYYECVGEHWPLLAKSKEHAIQYLEQIKGVLSIADENNNLLWYVRGKTLNGEKHGQIYRAQYQPKTDFDLSTNPHGNARNTCIQSTNTNNNNNNIRNASNNNNNKNRFDRHNVDINGNNEQRNTKQQKYYPDNRMRVNGSNFGSLNSSNNTRNCTIIEQKTTTSLYNIDLVGDDLFMELAKIDLECIHTNRKQIQRSGLCISGQRIRDASERLKHLSDTNNMKIMVNLGTVDILHGRDLADMCQDYINLVKVCNNRKIDMVITTLAPIGNRMHIETDKKKWREFNEFLVKRYSNKMLVIDIVPCMTTYNKDKILYECYQPMPKYISGSDQPHLLWNRIGRQRVLKTIKSNLRL